MHDISNKARMVNTESFDIRSIEMFEGLLSGIIAQDYDVTHIFIDSIFKSVPSATLDDMEGFIADLESLEEKFSVSFTIMISADESEAGPNLKKYVC